SPLKRRKQCTAIDVAADYSPTCCAWIINDRIDSRRNRRRCWRRSRRRVSRVLNKTLAVSPSVILAAARIRQLLYVDFFPRVLAAVADKHATVRAIKAVAKWIAQSQ